MNRIESRTEMFVRVLGMLITFYMVYATLFGQYRATIVHLALFGASMFTISFLMRDDDAPPRSPMRMGTDIGFSLIAIATFGYVVVEFERLVNLWGSSFLTTLDLVVGLGLVVVALEASRRQSWALFALAVIASLYMLFGNYLSGIFAYPGMDIQRFTYLIAFTSEGIFGEGLKVAAAYLFMFMLLGSALQATKTGDFIMNVASATMGRQTGGAAKTAMLASAGSGTVVGSSIGNVVATGTFTIPLMVRTGFRPHVAAAVETNTSEGSQLVPPILGATAFIMAQITGIPYATIAIAAILPAFLYYLSLYCVIHVEAVRANARALSSDEIPSLRQSMLDGWHLIISPVILFYLLIVESYTPAFASVVAIAVALAVGAARQVSRTSIREILSCFDDGVRQAASITALVASIGLLQAAIMTTGLGPRLTDIILGLSNGTLMGTALLTVAAATVLGMGMPTPIAYLLLAMVAAPALEGAGATTLGAHLFIFYFAIKSGSIPPVALVATVAASIAKANWWRTSIVACRHAIPSFIVAFMFLYSPTLLLQGDAPEIALALISAVVGVVALVGAVEGWALNWINWLQRLALLAGAVSLIQPGSITDLMGYSIVGGVFVWNAIANRRVGTPTAQEVTADQPSRKT